MNYYNDFETGSWLRELIKAELIPNGDVDDRSITEIKPDDLRGYRQCHFFAGIAGWSRALELAGWNTDEPVWSASLPCQPLSNAGQQRGHLDERNLWGVFCALVKECRPAKIFGEQVSSKLGREWLAGIQIDLETLGYISAAADLPAASVGAPHKRNRLFWCAVADTNGQRQQGESVRLRRQPGNRQARQENIEVAGASPTGRVGNTASRAGCQEHEKQQGPQVPGQGRSLGRVADSSDQRTGRPGQAKQGGNGQENRILRQNGRESANFWSNSILIPCADNKWRRVPGRVADSKPTGCSWSDRPQREGVRDAIERCTCDDCQEHHLEIEPALFPLADGIPERVGLLKGAGNSICAPVAAEFIKAMMEVI